MSTTTSVSPQADNILVGGPSAPTISAISDSVLTPALLPDETITATDSRADQVPATFAPPPQVATPSAPDSQVASDAPATVVHEPLTVRVGGMREYRDTHATVTVTDLGAFLGTPYPPDTIVALLDTDATAVLDADVHHWPVKPSDPHLAAVAAGIYPAADLWFPSHGRGLKLLYLGADANEHAHLAAMTVPRDFKVEIQHEFRHPCSTSTKHGGTAGAVHHNSPRRDGIPDLNLVGAPDMGDVDAYLAEHGMARGQRYTHEKCPIAGDESSDAGECVQPLDTGFYCYRCAGKGLHHGQSAKAGFVPYSALMRGSSTVLERLTQARVHWPHAQYELQHEYPHLSPCVRKQIYGIALKQRYGASDPRIPAVFNDDLQAIYTVGGWVDAVTLKPTKLDDDLVDSLPAVQVLAAPTQGQPPRTETNRVARSNIKSRLVKGFRPLKPYRGILLARPEGYTPIETPPKLAHPIQMLGDPLPLDEAFARLERPFPGISRTYLVASLAAMICAEMGNGQPPGLTATGPSGSGKGETLAIAASFLGDAPVKVTLDDNAEAFMRQIGTATTSGCRALVFDEFGKIRNLHQKMACILQLGQSITYRLLYANSLTTARLTSALFFPCVRFPEFLRSSPEFLRRTRGVHLTARVPNWRSTSGGDSASWRNRSKENALVGNSILTHAYAMCAAADFVFDGSDTCVANVLNLGSIGDGADGIDPENLRNLYRYAQGQLGGRVLFERDLTFPRGWCDLSAPQAKTLISVFSAQDEEDQKAWRNSVRANLEAASWNDVLGFAEPPVSIDIKIHGARWAMRFRNATPCKRGEEVLNEALPPIPDDNPPPALVGLTTGSATPTDVSPAVTPNILAAAGFPN